MSANVLVVSGLREERKAKQAARLAPPQKWKTKRRWKARERISQPGTI